MPATSTRSRYRVFLGAPTANEVHNAPSEYRWETFTSPSTANPTPGSAQDVSFVIPPATLEAASRRISGIYAHVIFNDNDDEEPGRYEGEVRDGSVGEDPSTMITWLPTQDQDQDPTSHSLPLIDKTSLLITHSLPVSRINSLLSSQDTTRDTSHSLTYSDASSIARFPNFHFLLSSLTSLASLARMARKINTLVAVLEVEGPDMITIKRGPEVGKQVGILKMIVGDEDGGVGKVTAWREVAETWGGIGGEVAVKRGDVVLLESVNAVAEPATTVALTASPNLKSKLTVCYRTMPYTHEDGRLRPDLRLGRSDAAVRKVAAVVEWFEGMAGLREGT